MPACLDPASRLRNLFIPIACFALTLPAAAADTSALIDQALAGAHREPQNVARDQYRHPKETLMFFGLEPEMTVVEISPGRGWYTEVLAPVLREHGTYHVATSPPPNATEPKYLIDIREEYKAKLAAKPDVYDKANLTALDVATPDSIAPAGSADMVLTFRNVHNWMKSGTAEQVFAAMYRALKPGGVLGVVEHRAAPGTSVEAMVKSGYVTEPHVIALAEAAGFTLQDRSEINANANDTKDHPEGVWSLPPTLREGDRDRDKYLAIGESDRMTLKFVKPQ